MAEIQVTNLNDSGAGSLREALVQANGNADADIITFTVSGTIALTSGSLQITNDVTIDGDNDGNDIPNVYIDGAASSGSIIRITGGSADVALLSLSISGGDATFGGGIYASYGTLLIEDTTISGNSAVRGGGVFAYYTAVTMRDSLIANNIAQGYTGSDENGPYIVPGHGGGIATIGGSLNLINTTIHGNDALFDGYGGGIFNLGTNAALLNCTVTENYASGVSKGGGLFESGGTLNIYNSVIANNASTSTWGVNRHDVAGVVDVAQNNVFGSAVNIVSGSNNLTHVANVGLGALADNGGTTETRNILEGSLLIDRGGSGFPNMPALDANGDPRVTNGVVDVGATEFQPPPQDPLFEVQAGLAFSAWDFGFTDPSNTVPGGADYLLQTISPGVVSPVIRFWDNINSVQVYTGELRVDFDVNLSSPGEPGLHVERYGGRVTATFVDLATATVTAIWYNAPFFFEILTGAVDTNNDGNADAWTYSLNHNFTYLPFQMFQFGDEIVTLGEFDDQFVDTDGQLVLDGGDGDDTIYAFGSGVNEIDDIDGGDGNDKIYYQSNGHTIRGGAGDDEIGNNGNDGIDYGLTTFIGGTGNDLIYGTSFSDIFIEGANEGDDIYIGNGSATIDYSEVGAAVVVNFALGSGPQNTGGAGIDTLAGFDRVIGSAFGDTLISGNADDTIEGGQGGDFLFGDLNTVVGDTVSYSRSAAGVTVNLAIALQTSAGDAAGDSLSGFENVTGSSLADTLSGNMGSNTLTGGGGNDTLIGGAGADILDGGDGTGDTASYAGSNAGVNVNLHTGVKSGGHAVGDTFISIENVTGSSQNDTIAGDANANVLNGALGTSDMITYANSTALVNVNLATNVVSGGFAEGDTISGFERVIGSAFDDVLAGNVFANQIAGGNGNDTIFGDAGADSLTGGNGFDTLDHSLSAGGVTINLALNTSSGGNAAGDIIGGFERVNGSNGGVDVLTGTVGVNILRGNGGNDFIEGGAGADILEGGLGSADTVLYTASNAAVTVNLLANTASGGHAQGDVISGFERVTGSTFGDTLIGNNSSNVLSGGLGNDMLTSGSGADSFVFNTALGATNIDSITDFLVVSDTIHLDDAIFTTAGALGALNATLFGFAATADASDRIIYDQATGALFYDTNGNAAGERTQFATLSTGLAMTAADFLVV